MKEQIIAILKARLGARFAGEDYDTDWVIGIDEAADEIMKLLIHREDYRNARIVT